MYLGKPLTIKILSSMSCKLERAKERLGLNCHQNLRLWIPLPFKADTYTQICDLEKEQGNNAPQVPHFFPREG
ncbi:hypothetical protein KSX_89110 [Ktedonospora formicarum]|uniref:Uncharacterized protein n=1 Tax=Ktedonospora formicarum TaxID=2778364 RepID=A0A8J3IE91_9CHLR|nr:hypothetical protein KSX_89110 [Ktedonospora formicarum]